MKTPEWLHATDRNGRFVKTAERIALLEEIRTHSRLYGDAPLAVPAVHIILMTSSGAIRLVKRGDKPENPFMWDKAVGGHVVSDDPSLPRSTFDDNARKEIAEEVGIEETIIATDPFHYQQILREKAIDPNRQALIQLIDHDPWQGGISRVKNGEPWLKRHNVATYAGIYDGPFTFVDGEAEDERIISKADLMLAIHETPWLYADGARIFMQRYFHLLRV